MKDPYFDEDLCVERLMEMYHKHKKLVICADFDDTLFDFHKKGFTFPAVVSILKQCQSLGFYIVIFTASAKERHDFIMEHCKSLGIIPDKINENAFPSPFGNHGKIFYNLLLDDRAALGEAYRILRKTLDKIRLLQ